MNPVWAVNAARTGYNQVGQFGSDVGYALYGHTPTALANLSRDAGNALMAADGPLGEVGEGAAAASGLAKGSGSAARFWGETNAAGGTVWLSEGAIYQSDFDQYVWNAVDGGGQVNIVSGLHGDIYGDIALDDDLYQEDLSRYGGVANVTVHNYANLTPSQFADLFNGPGTTIGAYCNSGLHVYNTLGW